MGQAHPGRHGAGYNPGAITQVQQADLRKVSTGGSGMSDQEALAAIQSAGTGQTSQQKQPSTSLAGIPGRMVKDVGQMITGIGIGAAHFLEHPALDIKGIARGVGETVHEVAPSSRPSGATSRRRSGCRVTATRYRRAVARKNRCPTSALSSPRHRGGGS